MTRKNAISPKLKTESESTSISTFPNWWPAWAPPNHLRARTLPSFSFLSNLYDPPSCACVCVCLCASLLFFYGAPLPMTSHRVGFFFFIFLNPFFLCVVCDLRRRRRRRTIRDVVVFEKETSAPVTGFRVFFLHSGWRFFLFFRPADFVIFLSSERSTWSHFFT